VRHDTLDVVLVHLEVARAAGLQAAAGLDHLQAGFRHRLDRRPHLDGRMQRFVASKSCAKPSVRE